MPDMQCLQEMLYPKRKRRGLADGGDKGNALAKNKKDTMRYQGKMYDEKK